ncbi:MAG TPA: polysaccharide biosynthesis/export family protein, partial [Bacteroidota bacterium]|nr:polysaccharide biosynthesis/export family protein [Bacteroidota bacterium]
MVKLKERYCTLITVCVICSILPASVLVAQVTLERDKTKVEDLESSLQDKIPAGVVQPAGVALESAIDPEKYFIGPSDAIAVNIWTNPPLNFLLTVTPEGTLIIPTIGEIFITDITLTKAKERIIKEIRKKYTTGTISATLVRPRPIVVLVTGNVESPGRFTLTSVDR